MKRTQRLFDVLAQPDPAGHDMTELDLRPVDPQPAPPLPRDAPASEFDVTQRALSSQSPRGWAYRTVKRQNVVVLRLDGREALFCLHEHERLLDRIYRPPFLLERSKPFAVKRFTRDRAHAAELVREALLAALHGASTERPAGAIVGRDWLAEPAHLFWLDNCHDEFGEENVAAAVAVASGAEHALADATGLFGAIHLARELGPLEGASWGERLEAALRAAQ